MTDPSTILASIADALAARDSKRVPLSASECGELARTLSALAQGLRLPPVVPAGGQVQCSPTTLRQWAMRVNTWGWLAGKAEPPDAADLRYVACLLYDASDALTDERAGNVVQLGRR